MLKFIKHHLDTITGVEIYPIISLLLFFMVFASMLFIVWKMPKKNIEELSSHQNTGDGNGWCFSRRTPSLHWQQPVQNRAVRRRHGQRRGLLRLHSWYDKGNQKRQRSYKKYRRELRHGSVQLKIVSISLVSSSKVRLSHSHFFLNSPPFSE